MLHTVVTVLPSIRRKANLRFLSRPEKTTDLGQGSILRHFMSLPMIRIRENELIVTRSCIFNRNTKPKTEFSG